MAAHGRRMAGEKNCTIVARSVSEEEFAPSPKTDKTGGQGDIGRVPSEDALFLAHASG